MPNGEQFEKKIAEWEKQSQLFQGQVQTSQKQITDYGSQLEALSVKDPLGYFKRFQEYPWAPAVGFLAPYVPAVADVIAKRGIKQSIDQAAVEVETSDFFARLYGEVPFAISAGLVTSADEVLTLLKPPATLSAAEIADVQATIRDMITTITRPPELPEAVELEEEFPELVAPPAREPLPGPIGIHKLTTQEILKYLKIPRVPEGAMSKEEWDEFLKLKGYTDEDIDMELQLKAEELITSWQDRNNQIESFKTGLAEMPEYKLTDMLKEMVVQPGLALAELAMIYFEHVSMPLAGKAYKNLIPDLEAEYQRFKVANPDAPDREALVHAWVAWDSPFEGWQQWVLKYMLMEGLVDPLTYVGWGIATKLTKPIPYVGRLVGAAERGAMSVLEAPFDLIKAGVRKVPKTLTQRATMAQHQASQYVERYLTKATARHLSSISMKKLTDASERAIKYALANPQLEDDIALAGREMLKHAPVDEALTKDWASRLGTTLRSEDLTRVTVENIDNLFEDMFRWKLITPREASGQLLKILNVGEITDATLKTAQRILETRAATIQRGAMAFTRTKTPLAAMRSLASKNFKTHIAIEESAAALARKETGAFSTLLHNVDLRLQGIWRNGIDRWVVRPFAESYLTFGMYGPMNVLEDYIRSSLGGVFPRRMNIEAWEKITVGLKVDPELKRYGISEMIGPLAREGPEREWNNWILQLAALGQKRWADKIYQTLVRIPGAYGMDVRRNFMSKRYLQLLAEAGGEEFKALAKAGPRGLPKLADRKLIKELEATVYNLKTTGNPDAIRGAKDLFTRKRVVRNEVNNILKEHPDLPNTARDYIMKAYDDDVIFREVVMMPETLLERIGTTPYYRGVTVREGKRRLSTYFTKYEREARFYGEEIIQAGVNPKNPMYADSAVDAARKMGVLDEYDRLIATDPIAADDVITRAAKERGYDSVIRRDGDWVQVVDPGIITKAPKLPTMPATPGDSIDATIAETRNILLDDFIRGPEVATQQYRQLADFLTALEVRSPQEMASAIQAVYKMSEIYGALPDQIIAQATIRSRGLPLAERRATFDADFDRIYTFLDAAGADIDKVVNKLRLTTIKPAEMIDWGKVTFSADITPEAQRLIRETVDSLPLQVKSSLESFSINPREVEKLFSAVYDSGKKSIVFKSPEHISRRTIIHEVAHGLADDLIEVNDVRFFTELARANGMDDLVRELTYTGIAPSFVHPQGRKLHETFAKQFSDYIEATGKLPRGVTGILEEYFPKTQRALPFTEGYKDASTRLFDTMTAKREYATEFRAQNMATRSEIFAGISKKEMTPDFWDNFYLQMNNEYRILNIRMAELDGQLVRVIEEMNIAAGAKITPRAPIVVKDRPLAPQDIATLLGVRGDDISRSLLDVLTVQNNKDFFVAYVQAMARPGDTGFTKEAIGAVYDQISYSLRVSPESMSWITSKQMELDGVRKELHSLYNSKMLPDEEIASIGKYLDDTADAVEKLMFHPELPERMTVKELTGIADPNVPLAKLWKEEQPYIKRLMGDIEAKGIRRPVTVVVYPDGRKMLWEGHHRLVAAQKLGIKDVPTSYVGPTDAPIKRAIKPEYANFDDLRQSSMDEAHKWYYKEYPDYTNANAFDAMMKTIYPYWTYESQRWFWLPRAFVRHPGTFTSFERWQNNSDYGYIHIPGTSIDVNPFRGTIFGTLTTRLTRRDFPEYYDSLGGAKGLIEFNDYLSRFGFYPGAHINIPLAMMGGLEQQMGETVPAIWKTPLNALIAARPESESVKWLSEHIFSDRFREYMTILETNKRGYNGSHIWTKVRENIPLTEEEQAAWDSARQEAALYGMGFEQFGLFRLRSDEQYKAYEESSKVIEEMTGYNSEQQDWLRKHGYRIWDMVGGISPTNQTILQELESYKWLGTVTPLLPSRQQQELRRLDLDWDDVMQFAESGRDKRLHLQQEFLAGVIGPRDYIDRLQTSYTEQRDYIDKKMEENPNMSLDGRKEYYKKYGIPIPVQHPMRELLNLYFSIELEDKYDEETGELMADWDSFFAQRGAIEDAILPELKDEWESYLSRNTTRMEEVRRDVSNTYFRKYYDVWEATLAAYPENEQKLINEFLYLERTGQQLDRQRAIMEMISVKTGNQLISSFRSDTSDNRAALRYANPHLDAWLFFWGRTTSFKTPRAEAIYQQISRDIGRRT